MLLPQSHLVSKSPKFLMIARSRYSVNPNFELTLTSFSLEALVVLSVGASLVVLHIKITHTSI